jgi:hypothetical protein
MENDYIQAIENEINITTENQKVPDDYKRGRIAGLESSLKFYKKLIMKSKG